MYPIGMNEKLEALRAKLEAERIEELNPRGLACEADITNARCHIHLGKKYARIDDRNSGILMVDMKTGEIFGIKGYGQIHRGHPYGTLDTIADWYWGEYYPRSIAKFVP